MNFYHFLKSKFSKTNIIILIVSLIILCLPFFIFYWMLPYFSELTIGNDYQIFSIQQQLGLQLSLANGQLPLYVPGFAVGHSAAALTLGQMYHPVGFLAPLYPEYWEGAALTANTVLKLAQLGLVHLLVFFFFKRLSLKNDFSFILSFIAVYNLRMLDMFRYGASLENYMAYIILSVTFGLFYLNKNKIAGAFTISIATYLLCVGGHPQIMYLGLLGAGFIYIITPFIISAIKPDEKFDKKWALQYYGYSAAWIIAGVLLASLYIFPLYFEFVKANSSRVGQDYTWSLAYSDSWGGAIGSFLRPLNAVVTGSFGGSSLLVLLLFLPIALFCRKVYFSIITMIGFIITVFLMSLGDATPLHKYFWEYFPLANSFRVPGRITMILSMPMSLTLAWLISINKNRTGFLKISILSWISLLGAASLFIFNFYFADKVPLPTHYIPARIIKDFPDWAESQVLWIGIASLIFLGIIATVEKISKQTFIVKLLRIISGIIFILLVIIQTGICMRYGTWVAIARETPTIELLETKLTQSENFFGNAGFGMELAPVTEQMNKSALDPQLAKFYKNIVTAKNIENAYKIMADQRRPDQVVIETNKQFPNPENGDSPSTDTVKLLYNTYNSLTLSITSQCDGVLTINYPYLPSWQASLNGKKVEIFRANGYQMGVKVPAGTSEIKFQYYSKAAVAGVITSLLILFGLLLYAIIHLKKSAKLKIILTAITLVLMALLFKGWENWTQNGDNLNTKYEWSSLQNSNINNIAFGRTTRASSTYLNQMPYYYYAGKAVDGNTSSRGWRAHQNDRSPFWQVDLGHIQKINLIKLYNIAGSVGTKQRPLNIQISDDGRFFKTAVQLNTRTFKRSSIETIDMKNTQTRFIRLWSNTRGVFGLGEVEVFN